MQLSLISTMAAPSSALDILDDIQHGTQAGYRLGCRCHRCRKAKQSSMNKHVEQLRQCRDCGEEFQYQHGQTGFSRCLPCMANARDARLSAAMRAREQRTCGSCGTEYFYSERSSHGRKYCSECLVAAKGDGRPHKRPGRTCPVCDEKHLHTNRLGVCEWCYNMMPRFMWDSFNKHKVPLDIILDFAESLSCAICDVDLTQYALDYKKRFRPIHAVDHDHTCCPAGRSCGSCVRGILCRKCNVAIGYLKDDAGYAEAAARYLRQRSSKA